MVALATVNPKPGDSTSPVRHFVIGSKWLIEGECRFEAGAYEKGAFRALDALDACKYPKEDLEKHVDRIYHPTENQPRSNFKRIWVNQENGLPYLSGKELFFFVQQNSVLSRIRCRKSMKWLFPPELFY